MNSKLLVTKSLLEKLQLPTDDKRLKEWHLLWWHNPRENGNHSMRLTDRGLEDFETKLEIKSYQVDFPEILEIFTNQLILNLDRYIDGPYYVTRKYIKVFTEKMAVQLILFGGDIQKFSESKTMSLKYNRNTVDI
jgi:hypothetical protein